MKIKRSSYRLSYYYILIYMISHLWSGTDSELIRGYSINVPHHVTVQRGLCVYIPCSFTVPRTVTLTRNAKGIWYNKDEESVASRSNTKYETNGRFFLVGDVWRGDCSLYIEDPLYEDEGHYRFRVEEDNIKFSYQDIKPYVKVTDLNKPEISPIKSWLDGEEVTLRCTSPRTCVRRITPKITWRGNIQSRRLVNWVKDNEDGTKTHFSTITFTARKEQNNSPLTCTVELKEGLTTVQEITMKVEYKPQIIGGSCRKVENRLECTCQIQSFPEPNLKWIHNGVFYNNSNHTNAKVSIFTQTSNSVTNSTMTLPVNAEESQNIQCVASNLHGELVLGLFNETAQLTSKAFPSAAIYGGCFAAVLIVTGILLIIFYRKKKMMQNKEATRRTHADVVDHIYGNSEMFSHGPHEVGKIPQQDRQPPSEDGSVHLNCQNVQYMSVDFSKLKPKVAETDTDAEEVEYSVVKRRT
ncbi:sialic acid-binding Ig-like lectin 12 [Rana temporaria]|uniref:sialic acid-binding Ig-like lectin 12 n=1 Tax=Rana temporaria TaxID=8407 RepID=UPI001AAE0759|nr:sialic acid-binding Ig-like lectin 12 [Rana temporaria]XP_040183208.1 sialic acid-binding Ig-like lectin 12 [Rana temporaria]